MLEPHSRKHLIEALRPPPGYELDVAIGTTYTLNLLTLLTAPLAFTIFDWEDAEGRPKVDPLALLETMRRYADRIAIFCEAGRIQVPPRSHQLFAHLESSVLQVSAPNGGSFHPKVWALRFEPTEEGPVLYRLLCASRNLTFDRSWDTLLLLEGELAETEVAGNGPLADFFGDLPNHTVHAASARVRATASLLREELGRVRFEPPRGFDSVSFRPLGLAGYGSWPFPADLDRLLVVSPFLTRGILRRLAVQSPEGLLVSRVESLAKIPPEELKAFADTCVLGPEAEPEGGGEAEGEEDVVEGADADVELAAEHAEARLELLLGLHAKLYVGDRNDRAHVWTGSANATDAAFSKNVEFLAELAGDRESCGTDALLEGKKGSSGFRNLIKPYQPEEGVELNETEEELESLAEGARRALARAGFEATVEGARDEAEEAYDVVLRARDMGRLPEDPRVSVSCWPTTLRRPGEGNLGPGGTAAFKAISFEALTSFFCFEVVAESGGQTATERFVLNVPLENAPEDRRERILRSLVNSEAKLLRLVLFLLAEGGSDGEAVEAVLRVLAEEDRDGKDGTSGDYNLPLFEQMVRALAQNPSALDRIDTLLTDMRGAEETRGHIPEGWDSIWEPIMTARKEMMGR